MYIYIYIYIYYISVCGCRVLYRVTTCELMFSQNMCICVLFMCFHMFSCFFMLFIVLTYTYSSHDRHSPRIPLTAPPRPLTPLPHA